MYDNDDMKKMAEVFEGMLRKGKLQELTPMLEGIAPVAETRALQEMYHGKAKNDPKLVKKGAEARKKGELDYQFGPGDDHPHAENPWKFPEHKPGSLKNQKVAPKGKKDESTTYYAWQTLGLEEGNPANKAKKKQAMAGKRGANEPLSGAWLRELQRRYSKKERRKDLATLAAAKAGGNPMQSGDYDAAGYSTAVKSARPMDVEGDHAPWAGRIADLMKLKRSVK